MMLFSSPLQPFPCTSFCPPSTREHLETPLSHQTLVFIPGAPGRDGGSRTEGWWKAEDKAQENTHGGLSSNHWGNLCRGVNGALRGITCCSICSVRLSVWLSPFPRVALLSPINPFRGGARLCHRNPALPFPGGRSPVKSARLFSLRVNVPKAPMGFLTP